MTKEITEIEAIQRAKKYNLTYEVIRELRYGSSPYEALKEWDLLDENEI